MRQHETGVSVQATLSSMLGSRENKLTFGGAFSDSKAFFTQSSRFGYLTPDRGVLSVDGDGAFADGTQDSENAFDARVELRGETRIRSLYLTDTLSINDITQLTLSGRYDRSTVENRDGLTPGGGPGSLDGDHTFSRFNPAVGVTVTPSEAFGAYFGYTEGSRAPSAIELGCADPENPCKLPNAMAGDPPLDQVVTRTFEAGIRGVAAGTITWNAGIFHAQNRDDIMFVADDTSGFGYFENFGKTRRQGGELGVSAKLGTLRCRRQLHLPRCDLSLGGRSGRRRQQYERREGPGFEGTIDVEEGDRIPLTPRHIFKAFAAWQVLPQLSLNVDSITVAGTLARGNENNDHEPDGQFYIGQGRTGG